MNSTSSEILMQKFHRPTDVIKESILKGQKRKIQPKLLHRFFDDVVDDLPDHPAIITEDEHVVTYMELFEASNRYGRAIYNILMSRTHIFNDFHDWIVALYMKPSYHAIAVMLGIWKSGAAYLPLSYQMHNNKLKQIMNEAKPQLIIVEEELLKPGMNESFANVQVIAIKELIKTARKLSKGYITDDFSTTLGIDNMALVLYSSEILSPPKGTRIHHFSCQQRLEWQWINFPFQHNETHCISHNALFHIDHFSEIWGPLLRGLTLVLMKDESRNDIDKLIAAMERFNVVRFYGLPLKINKILHKLSEFSDADTAKDEKKLNKVNLWISSGEELPMDVAVKFFDYYQNDGMHCLTNFYGCTETTGDCCCYVIKSLEQLRSLKRIPIGTPINNAYIYIFDESEDTIEKGHKGKIYVSGPLIAQSYVGNNNKEAFIRNPLNLLPDFWKMFETGDYGTIIDELLYYDGRDKLTIRYDDYVINYPVIESFISEREYVDKVVVLPMVDRLVAFITLRRLHSNKKIEAIRDDLSAVLPVYAMPEVVLVLKIPTLENDDVDKQALEKKYDEIKNAQQVAETKVIIDLEGVPVQKHEMARKVFTILGKNIGCELKGVLKGTSNFFYIGGTSLNVLSSIYELHRAGFRITTDDFLDAKDFLDILNKVEVKKFNETQDYAMEVPKEWRIELAMNVDRDECSELLAECYCRKHVLMKTMRIDPKMKVENMQRFLESNWQLFVEQRLSFKVIDGSDKIIGVALNFEVSDERYLDMRELDAIQPIFEFRTFVEENFLQSYYQHSMILTNFIMGTSSSLSPVENVRLIYFMELYLTELMKASEFQGIYSNVTCPLNACICKMILGYKTLKEFAANRFVDKNGERPFKNADDNIIKFIQIYENRNHK